jgi:hypothetical protein
MNATYVATYVAFFETTFATTTRTGFTRPFKIRQRAEQLSPALRRARKLWGFHASAAFTSDMHGKKPRRIPRSRRLGMADRFLRTDRPASAGFNRLLLLSGIERCCFGLAAAAGPAAQRQDVIRHLIRSAEASLATTR